MTSTTPPVLYVIVCAAGPADRVSVLIEDARARGWDTHVVATPSARDGFLAIGEIEKISGHPVRARWRRPGEPGSLPSADAPWHLALDALDAVLQGLKH